MLIRDIDEIADKINIKKPFSFTTALKLWFVLGLLDIQDANSMLKHRVFAMHLGISNL